MAGIVGNLLLLGYFKYTDFFLGVVNDAAGRMVFDLPRIVLPLGISFYTFTQTAYLVDAYRGLARNPSFVAYLEFVTIFPHLIAGPIINHKDMMPQFLDEANYHVRWDNMAKGITLFMMGLFKKVVIADNLAPWANDAFARPDALSFLEAWAGAFAYTMQLYFDFSGYSEMAIGLGLLLNLRLPMNFDSPYRATSIIDFWRRWHMTLGLWVKNYPDGRQPSWDMAQDAEPLREHGDHRLLARRGLDVHRLGRVARRDAGRQSCVADAADQTAESSLLVDDVCRCARLLGRVSRGNITRCDDDALCDDRHISHGVADSSGGDAWLVADVWCTVCADV